MREEAKEYYEKAIRMTHEGRKSQLNLVNPLCNLGYLMQAEGNNERALTNFQQALRILKENQRSGETTYSSIS
jgi:tetratricopeptide (TPR) repeat protein